MVAARLGLFFLVASGCTSPEEVFLQHRSTLEVQSRGVVVSERGEEGLVGMKGMPMACDFWVSGELGADYDTSGEVDVVDGAPGEDGGVLGMGYVGLSPGFVHLIRPYDFPSQHDVPLDHVVAAGALSDGFVAVRDLEEDDGGCVLEWHGPGGVQDSADLDATLCDGDTEVTVDPTGRTAFVANGGPIVSVYGSAADPFDTTAELVVWDEDAEVLYASAVGSDVVRAIESDGTQRWTVTVGGGVVALEAMGEILGAGVMIELPSGLGQFVILDAEDGSVRSEVDTPTPAHALTASGDGSVVGMVLEREVHWYDLSPRGF